MYRSTPLALLGRGRMLPVIFFWPVLAIYLFDISAGCASRRQGARRRVKKKEEWQVSRNGSYADDMATLFRSPASSAFFHQRR